ncbi:hypothetical protein H6B07_12655 [Mediterraneibacter glycyrrhizinilyticus]|nr:hypothetical protein [Mediterraneibacter glycyrrhizinilyticus]MBM6803490.1 hypothetical protein [Mediterraneibacter glycyrrhizinilyticus]HJC90746.1 hypothetical protein [Candidatus Mediterraneibacter excrementigallinarum]
MKRTIVFFLCAALCAVSVGCAGRNADSVTENSDKELAEEFNKDDSLLEESTGSIGFGYVDPPQNGYVYDGTELEVPYYIENTGGENEQNAEVGLLFFVDGEAQPYSTNEDGKETDESYMHKFSIAPGDRLDFDAAFTPVSGKEGEEIGLIPAIIWNPDYIPEDLDSARFGNCYSLSANVPLTITMQADGSGIHTPSSKEAEITDIPEDIILSLEDTYSEGAYDFLDDSVGFEIETENDKSVLEAENGKVNVTLNLYGGKQVTDKITLFIGNQPVQIEDGDYTVIHTQKDKMCQVKAQIDVKALKEPAVMYAVAMTSGDDYITQDIYMTAPVLIQPGN